MPTIMMMIMIMIMTMLMMMNDSAAISVSIAYILADLQQLVEDCVTFVHAHCHKQKRVLDIFKNSKEILQNSW